MIIIAWFAIGIVDAEATRTGQTPIMPGLKAYAVIAINRLLTVSIETINSGIAIVYPFWQMIALVVLLGVGTVAWRWKSDDKEESESPTKECWNAQRVRNADRGL